MAGILDEARHRPGDRPGLRVLLGPQPAVTPPRVRQFVIDTALGVIAEGFEAEAVVIARRDGPDQPPQISCRMPPSWDAGSGLAFELFGRLWQELDREGGGGRGRRAGVAGAPAAVHGPTLTLGGRHGWICRQQTVAGVLAAGVVRGHPFTPPEQSALGRVVRSVGVAVGSGAGGGHARGRVQARTRGGGDRWWADVVLRAGPGGQRRAGSWGASQELAVARAAAALATGSCEVSFAGTTHLEGTVITVVVVNDAGRSPLIGLSIGRGDATAGPAEAVLAALEAADPDTGAV